MLVSNQLQDVLKEISENTDLPPAAWSLIQKYVRAIVQLTVAQQIDWRPFDASNQATWPKHYSTVWAQFDDGQIYHAQFIVGSGNRPQWAATLPPSLAGRPVAKWFYALSPLQA